MGWPMVTIRHSCPPPILYKQWHTNRSLTLCPVPRLTKRSFSFWKRAETAHFWAFLPRDKLWSETWVVFSSFLAGIRPNQTSVPSANGYGSGKVKIIRIRIRNTATMTVSHWLPLAQGTCSRARCRRSTRTSCGSASRTSWKSRATPSSATGSSSRRTRRPTRQN